MGGSSKLPSQTGLIVSLVCGGLRRPLGILHLRILATSSLMSMPFTFLSIDGVHKMASTAAFSAIMDLMRNRRLPTVVFNHTT